MISISKIQEELVKRLLEYKLTINNNPNTDTKTPFISINFMSQLEEANKVANIKETFFYIHVWTKKGQSNYLADYLDTLNKALEDRLEMGKGIALVNTTCKVIQILPWEKDNKHAVLEVGFKTVTK